MPVFHAGPGKAPSWCELEQFDIVRLEPGQKHKYARSGKREKIIVAEGRCRLKAGDQVVEAAPEAIVDLPDGKARFEVLAVHEPAVLVRVCGRWSDPCGGCGLFQVNFASEGRNDGDPAAYPTQTVFDRHFHDCDEYWIIYEGSGVAVTEGKHYAVQEGDCIAIGMHHHHDFPIVHAPVKAVYFETTLEGAKREGHLWEHKHGKAQPKMERV